MISALSTLVAATHQRRYICMDNWTFDYIEHLLLRLIKSWLMSEKITTELLQKKVGKPLHSTQWEWKK